MSLWPLYRALGGLGIVCAALVAVVHEQTAPIVAAKRLAALENRVRDVVPGSIASEPWAWVDDAFEPSADAADADVWVARDATGALVGFAVEGAAMGYQDVVRLLWGLDPAARRIVGMRVLQSRETPGLGDRVEKDADFVTRFSALPADLDASGTALASPPVLDGEGPTSVDAITGATISSRAVVEAVATSAGTWVPRLVTAADAGVFDGGGTRPTPPEDAR